MDQDFTYCNDVLIPKDDLQDKVAKITELRQRMQELIMEQEYRIRQNEISHTEAIREVTIKNIPENHFYLIFTTSSTQTTAKPFKS